MSEKYHSLKVREETYKRLTELSNASNEYIYELLERVVKREHQLWQAGYYAHTFGDTLNNPYRTDALALDTPEDMRYKQERGEP